MDYFVISSDYPDLVKAVEEIFINIDTINVVASNVADQRRICDIPTEMSINTKYDQSISY
jgi:hypothetical protein